MAGIIRLVEQAQSRRSRSEQVVDRLERPPGAGFVILGHTFTDLPSNIVAAAGPIHAALR